MIQEANFSHQIPFWTNTRLQTFSIGLLIAIALAIAITYATDIQRTSMLYRGDFPGFYGPVVTLHRGLSENLYDLDLQKNVQNEFWPNLKGNFYPSLYPPYTYIFLYPLGFFSASIAQVIFTNMLFSCYAIAIKVLFSLINLDKKSYLPTFAFLTSLCPVLVSIFCAQNTAISLLVLVLATKLYCSGKKSGPIYAGLVYGLLLYKPQLAIPGLTVMLLSGELLFLVGATITLLGYYIIGSLLLGPMWPIKWAEHANAFAQGNFSVNAREIASLSGLTPFFKELFSYTCLSAQNITLISTLLMTAIYVCCFLIALIKVRSFRQQYIAKKDSILSIRYLLLLGPVTILLSPQSLFYDLTLALVPCVAFVKPATDRHYWLLITFSLFLLLIFSLRDVITLPMFVFISLICFVASLRRTA